MKSKGNDPQIEVNAPVSMLSWPSSFGEMRDVRSNGQLKEERPTPWSQSLQQQTREAIETLALCPDGNLYFKHKKAGYARATLEGLMGCGVTLISKAANEALKFESVESLLQAGWVID